MYSFLKSSLAAVAGWVLLANSAMANDPTQSCGTNFPGAPACQVPEPGSLALVAVAIAGVVIAAKFSKKK